LLNYVGFVSSETAVRESWSAAGDPVALAAHFAGWDPVIGKVIAAISAPGGSGFQWGMYDRAPLPTWSSGRLLASAPATAAVMSTALSRRMKGDAAASSGGVMCV